MCCKIVFTDWSQNLIQLIRRSLAYCTMSILFMVLAIILDRRSCHGNFDITLNELVLEGFESLGPEKGSLILS